MQLFYSPNSPYARIARVALRETGLIEIAEETPARNRRPDNPVLAHSPLGRVPTLVVGGLTLTETRPVFDYIMEAGGHPRRIAPWQELARETLIFGALESIVARIREDRRGADASGFLRQVETDRIERCLVQLEREAERLEDFPTFGAVTLAVALELLDCYDLRPGWTARQPMLARWLPPQRLRPSMAATAPVGD